MAFYKSRTIAYETNKILGDVSGIMGGGVASQFRSGLYGGAKTLGDINAAMGSKSRPQAGGGVSGRIISRVFGGAARTGLGFEGLPAPVKRLANKTAGENLQKIRSHGLYGKKNTASGGKIKYKNVDIILNQTYQIKIDEFLFDKDAFVMLASQSGVFEMLKEVGTEILEDIVYNAPKDTGEYEDSFFLNVTTNKYGTPLAYIITYDWYKGKWLEYGTVKMAPRPTIRNAFAKQRGGPFLAENWRGTIMWELRGRADAARRRRAAAREAARVDAEKNPKVVNGKTTVSSYTRKNGTKVSGHQRTITPRKNI